MNFLEYPFEGLVEAFQQAALDALLRLLPTMLFILTIGFLTYLVWTVAKGSLSDEPNLFTRVTKEIILFAVFYGAVATSPGWLGYIPGFFEDLGRTATGLDNVSVSSLFHRGIELAVEISGLVNSLFPLAELILLPFRLGTALMIALAFAFAAYRLVEIKVFFAVMLGGLAFNLGFGGNPWTWPLAAGYLRGLAQKGIELTVAYFLVGHANAVLETWVEVAQSVTELTWGNYVTLMLAPPAISFLIWRMPEKVAAAVTSTWTLPSPFERA